MNQRESSSTAILSAAIAVEDSNRLRYSANGNDVILRTRIGDMNLVSDEFTFYQLLFKIADINNTGRLTPTDSHLATLLNRTKLSTQQLDTILSHVNGKSTLEGNDVQGLSFSQWLVLCKLVAYTQYKSTSAGTDYTPKEDALEQVHISSEPYPLADFSIGKIDDLPHTGLIDDFQCEIKGYKVHGEGGFQQQHIKFTIAVIVTTESISSSPPSTTASSYVASPIITSSSTSVATASKSKSASKAKKNKKPIDNDSSNITQPSNGNGSPPITFPSSIPHNHAPGKKTVTQIEVIRRYSDFELLSSILHRFYPACVTPPLPPKAWGFSSVSDAIGIQRSRELQMFLNHVVRHPILRHTYEVKAFLETSASGFRGYRELFPRIQIIDGKVSMIPSPTSTNPSNSIFNILGVSSSAASNAMTIASNVSTSISQTKAYGFVSTIFGSVRNVITSPLTSLASAMPATQSTSAATSNYSARFEHSLKDTLKFEENIGKVSTKVEQVLSTEGRMIYEISQLAYHMKQMSDYGNDSVGGAEVDLQHTFEHIELMTAANQQALDSQIRSTLSPIQYSSRYLDALRAVIHHKDAVIRELEACHVKQGVVRKSLDQARTSLSQTPDEIQALSVELDQTAHAITSLKKQETHIIDTLDNELVHLRQTNVHDMDVSLRAFAAARLASCQQNLTILEQLRKSLVDSKSWRPEVSGILVLDEFV